MINTKKCGGDACMPSVNKATIGLSLSLSLVLAKTCCLFGTKPLPETIADLQPIEPAR